MAPFDGIFPLSDLTASDVLQALLPVAVKILAMTVYAVCVFKFYRFIGRRDIFTVNLSGGGRPASADALPLLGYVVRFVILFPAFALLWLATLTVMLALLSEDRQLSTILGIVLATVGAIRVCAYYDEDLSRDLAKMLPFAVLAIVVIDTASLDVQSSVGVLGQIGGEVLTIFWYWVLLIVLEMGLRLVYGLFRALFPGRIEKAPSRTASDGSGPVTDD